MPDALLERWLSDRPSCRASFEVQRFVVLVDASIALHLVELMYDKAKDLG